MSGLTTLIARGAESSVADKGMTHLITSWYSAGLPRATLNPCRVSPGQPGYVWQVGFEGAGK